MIQEENTPVFPCTGCSACCRKLRDIYESASKAPEGSTVRTAADEFPYGWDDSGVCTKLKDNLCSVYEDRPLICDVGKLTVLCHNKGECDIKTLYALNALMCNQFINEFNLSEEFKVDPRQFFSWDFKEDL